MHLRNPLSFGLVVWLTACQPSAETIAATHPHAAPAAARMAVSAGEQRRLSAGVRTVCFEPEDDCIGLMTEAIDQAREEVLVMAFLFSNRRIVRAVNRASERGVRVRMVVTQSREGAGRVLAVQRRGAEVLTRDGLTQHSKYLIIDRRRVITGSQNFTASSETNSENTLVIDDPMTVAAYVRNWERRAAGSRSARDTLRPAVADADN